MISIPMDDMITHVQLDGLLGTALIVYRIETDVTTNPHSSFGGENPSTSYFLE